MLLNCGVGEDSWEWVPWTASRSNQSILKEIGPGCSFEGLILKLKLQSFGHLMRRADSFEKTLMLGKIEGRRRRDNRGWDGWMELPTQWTWVRVNSGSWWWTGRPGVLWFMGSQRVWHDLATELNRIGNFSKGGFFKIYYSRCVHDILILQLWCSPVEGRIFFFFFKWGVYFEVVFLLDAVCYEDIFYIVYI